MKNMNQIPDLPKVPITNEDNALYAWIIGTLILFILGLFWKLKNTSDTYERKLEDIQLRLDHVIDESMDRMERKDDLNREYIDKLNALITKLHEILVFINR